jgi:hypothetical protein
MTRPVRLAALTTVAQSNVSVNEKKRDRGNRGGIESPFGVITRRSPAQVRQEERDVPDDSVS